MRAEVRKEIKKKRQTFALNLHGRTYCLFEKKIVGQIFV